jgi:hypothetical protein
VRNNQVADRDNLKRLMSQWQSTLQFDDKSAFAYQSEDKQYQRRLGFEEPSLISMMLNTSIQAIFANEKFCFYLSDGGLLYSTGFDFRVVNREELYGIPRQLSVAGQVK